MWNWLITLPIEIQVIVICTVCIIVFAISIFGNIGFKTKLGQINFGWMRNNKKRSCGDCILIILGKRETTDSKKAYIDKNVLKDQMNFAEQKLLEVKTDLLTSYKMLQRKHRTNNIELKDEVIQYKVYRGAILCALELVKDEIRRSFKENGFEDMDGSEFSVFVKNKSHALYSLGKNYIEEEYPYEGMIVTLDERQQYINDFYLSKINDMCFDVFQKAKDIKIQAKLDITNITTEFAKEIDNFILDK